MGERYELERTGRITGIGDLPQQRFEDRRGLLNQLDELKRFADGGVRAPPRV